MPETSSSAESPYAPSQADNQPQTRPRRLIPPWWIIGLVSLFVVLVAALQFGDVMRDHALDNILSLVFSFLGLATIGWWFVRHSGYPRAARWAGAVCPLFGVLLAAVLLRIDHVSGEMVPVFRFRWAPPPDELLEAPAPNQADEMAADLSVNSDADYPEFLGPDRRAVVSNLELARDWQRHPPKERWRQPIGAGWSAFSAVNGFAVTMEQRGNEELVTCYHVETGELVWSRGISSRHYTTLGGVGPRSTPTIDGGLVYTLGATGNVFCLDGSSGEIIWQDNLLLRYGVEIDKDIEGVAWGRSNSPLIVGDLVVIPAGGPAGGPHVSLLAYNKRTGQVAWEGGHRQVSYSSPVFATLAGVPQIISVNQDFVSGHHVDNGKQLWEVPWEGSSTTNANVSQPVPLPPGRLFLSKGYGMGAGLFRLAATAEGTLRLQEIWRNPRVLKTKFTNVVIVNGYVFGLSDGILECVRLEDGERQWKRGRYGHGQLIGVGDLLLVTTEAGELVLVNATPKRLEELGSFPALSGKTWNNPCLYGRFLLLRNAEEACCLELATRSDSPSL